MTTKDQVHDFNFELTIIHALFQHDQRFEVGDIAVCHSLHHDLTFDSERNRVRESLTILGVHKVVGVDTMFTVGADGKMIEVPGIMLDKIAMWFPVGNFVKITSKIKNN